MKDLATSRIIYVSPAYETLWGRTCASLYASPQNWQDAIHPEDRERIVQSTLTNQPTARRRQQPIQGGSAEVPDQLAIPTAQRPVPQFVKGQPLAQDRHQLFAARLFGAEPDLPHHRLNPFVAPFGPNGPARYQ